MAKIQMHKQSDLTIAEAVEIHINHCKILNYAKDTIKHYENTIHNFSLFYDLDNPLDTVNKELVDKYQLYLLEKGLAEETVRTYISGLRTILYYLMDEELLSSFRITVPKVGDQIKDIYTTAELKKLLKKPNIRKCSFVQYRNWVMVSYFVGTGQRLNSVINIKIKDLDFENEVVTLKKTKGRREVILPLTTSLVRILKEYLSIRKGVENDYLFCTQDGKQLARNSAVCAIKNYNRSRGVSKTSIHLFRHTYAKNYLNNGGSLFKLKRLMAHSDLKSTERYLNLLIDDVRQDYQEYNQLEQIMNNRIVMGKGRA